jgi:hypothetical protein
MTNAQMIENFSKQLIKRVAFRMDNFGDTYEKAKAMIQIESCAGISCWLIVDKHFAQTA